MPAPIQLEGIRATLDRVAKYFAETPTSDRLVVMSDPSSDEVNALADLLDGM